MTTADARIGFPIPDEDGWPKTHRGVVQSVPGLYFLGLLFQYSFTSMLVLGAGRDANFVVDRIAERVRGAQLNGRARQAAVAS